ncbi:4-hydroxybenzoate decarboxylase subunit C [Thalassoglobus neptunius]|uniref:4-hydroxybenzoate decarboxylase subunit C n=1 Tax=Thalassoglobus neptunius TaxID=1938619 RepID=A0A5C5WJA9_9PLAN|nr:UbiD family decarboxylase [Thalassoglobus neptunius]TWT49932.1 4-hydroxybenzoate decarboxylase subunit C [Thalassoglobus neptunius]
MGYRNLKDCVVDLEKHGQLVRITSPVDPHLEAAEIQRRVYQAGGPALLFENVTGCQFPMLSNLFGTIERTRFLFRDTIDLVKRLVEIKIDPAVAIKNPLRYGRAFPVAWAMQPKYVSRGPLTQNQTSLDQLPQLVSWPDDGGPFVTLPAVYSEHPAHPGWQKSNLGMYRIQMAGNDYTPNREVGVHYQIHRSIGVHHAAAIQRGEALKVNIFIGGPPALPLSAVMPLPEGLSELTFAGALGGRRVRMIRSKDHLPLIAEADFCISGTIDPQRLKPEGPFGDHLGYYSLRHDFPVLNVERVYHRNDAIWPFTVVGRPPQEDTSFGEIIHEITGPAIPSVLPGVKQVHAVDAAGVHPLLLAIGSERYVPYAEERVPQEILTQANAILGQGQLSLAKYLFIAAEEDAPELNLHDIDKFFHHILERVDWRRDLHFQTKTTIDTLDYSGDGFNSGSKVVVAAAGKPVRELSREIPESLRLPFGFSTPKVALPGVLAVQAPPCERADDHVLKAFCDQLSTGDSINHFPLCVLVDDSEFTARSLNNFLWTVFTRSNPAADIDGIESFIDNKHWGCRGSLVIDARIKPKHAPPLIEDPKVTAKVDALAQQGGPLHGIL